MMGAVRLQSHSSIPSDGRTHHLCSIPLLKQNMDSAFGASLVNVNCSPEKLTNKTDLKIELLVAAPGLDLKWFFILEGRIEQCPEGHCASLSYTSKKFSLFLQVDLSS